MSTEQQDKDNELMRTEVHTIQVVALDMVTKWLPILVSILALSGTVVAMLIQNQDRLSKLETTTFYIVKQLDQLSVKVDALTLHSQEYHQDDSRTQKTTNP